MLGIDNQDFAYFFRLTRCLKEGFEGHLCHVFVIVDFVGGDLLSDIWLFTLKGLLMLRCSYNW
jgi:hypothetical protein|tara:strand:+ start:3026 stop:3214 length:189 start_codon:yes stop_codon:yes gene_type:complete